MRHWQERRSTLKIAVESGAIVTPVMLPCGLQSRLIRAGEAVLYQDRISRASASSRIAPQPTNTCRTRLLAIALHQFSDEIKSEAESDANITFVLRARQDLHA